MTPVERIEEALRVSLSHIGPTYPLALKLVNEALALVPSLSQGAEPRTVRFGDAVVPVTGPSHVTGAAPAAASEPVAGWGCEMHGHIVSFASNTEHSAGMYPGCDVPLYKRTVSPAPAALPMSDAAIDALRDKWAKEPGWAEFEQSDFRSMIRSLVAVPMTREPMTAAFEIGETITLQPGCYEIRFDGVSSELVPVAAPSGDAGKGV